MFEAEGAEVKRVGPLAPNMNAYAERFVQTLRVECLDHFVVCGEKHLQHLVKEMVAHYHEERPHQSLENEPIRKVKKRGRRKIEPVRIFVSASFGMSFADIVFYRSLIGLTGAQKSPRQPKMD